MEKIGNKNYKILTPFKGCVLQNFPFIEADFDALTNYQLLCKVVEYLNMVIHNENELTEEVEGLYNAYVSLLNYINNLDIQEEVNKKLDEMAESGQLTDIIAQYLGLAGMITFNTVAEMKLAENLVNGSKCQTLGFYNVSDGGGANYKIRTLTNEDVIDEKILIALYDNTLVAELVNNKEVYPEMLGAKGDGTTDDTSSIQTALNFAIRNGKPLNFKKSTYKVASQILFNDNTKSLILNGNNATISLVNGASYSVFNLVLKDIKINDLKIDGVNTTQDQFNETIYSNLKLYTGFNLNANSIIIDNIKLSNMYGNGFKFFNYNNISITNVDINNVGGHWYQNNEYDAFGDGFYFGGHSDNAQIQIINTNVIGKYKENTLSRIGMTFENLTDLIDVTTNIDIINSNFINFDRCIHAESLQGKVYLSWNKGNTKNNVFAFSLPNALDKLIIDIDNLNITYTNNSYNGTYGIKGTTFNIKNSIINAGIHSIANFINTGSYNNCIFNDIKATQVNSVGSHRIDLNKCILNVTNALASTNLLYNSSLIYLNECTINSDTAFVQSESGNKYHSKSCIFNNIIPYTTFEDINNKIYTTNYTLNDYRYGKIMPCYYYADNVLIYEPSTSKTFRLKRIEDSLNYGIRSVPSGSTIPLVPDFASNLHYRNSKYVLITIGTENDEHLITGRHFQNFYYNILSVNQLGEVTAGKTQTIGTPTSGGYGLTIDDTNKTIARSGTYAQKACQWIIPYDEFTNLSAVS